MSEATVQAEFYHHCRLIGLNAALEFHTPAGRLDCAILSPDETLMLCIVECKKPNRPKVEKDAQIERYMTLGVPVYGLCNFDKAASLAHTILSANHRGRSIDEILRLPRLKARRLNGKWAHAYDKITRTDDGMLVLKRYKPNS